MYFAETTFVLWPMDPGQPPGLRGTGPRPGSTARQASVATGSGESHRCHRAHVGSTECHPSQLGRIRTVLAKPTQKTSPRDARLPNVWVAAV